MIHKKVIGQKFCRIFFRPKMELKVAFGQRVSICKCIFVQVITTKFQHCHELIHGITIHDTFFTLIRVKEELTGHGIHNASGQVLVLHGVRLITCLLYDGQRSLSTKMQGEICGSDSDSMERQDIALQSDLDGSGRHS